MALTSPTSEWPGDYGVRLGLRSDLFLDGSRFQIRPSDSQLVDSQERVVPQGNPIPDVSASWRVFRDQQAYQRAGHSRSEVAAHFALPGAGNYVEEPGYFLTFFGYQNLAPGTYTFQLAGDLIATNGTRQPFTSRCLTFTTTRPTKTQHIITTHAAETPKPTFPR